MDATVWVSLAGLASTVAASGIGFYFAHKAQRTPLRQELYKQQIECLSAFVVQATLMQQLAASGKSIIVISSELPEILRVANRIAVFANGRITGTLRNEEASQEKIMQLAAHGEED